MPDLTPIDIIEMSDSQVGALVSLLHTLNSTHKPLTINQYKGGPIEVTVWRAEQRTVYRIMRDGYTVEIQVDTLIDLLHVTSWPFVALVVIGAARKSIALFILYLNGKGK